MVSTLVLILTRDLKSLTKVLWTFISYLAQNKTNRAGKPGKDDLFGVAADDAMGDWLSRNPDLGMTIGLPDSKMGAL
jgi:hypothetical protein